MNYSFTKTRINKITEDKYRWIYFQYLKDGAGGIVKKKKQKKDNQNKIEENKQSIFKKSASLASV